MKAFWAVLALSLVPLANAQTLKLSVFERLKDKASDITDLNLSKDMLGLVGGFFAGAKDEDAAKVKKLADGLQGILVRSLEFDKEGEFTDADVQSLMSELAGPGWNLIVRADENKGKKNQEISRIWIKAGTPGEVGGLRIMTAEPKELTVVAIEGKVRLEDLKNLEGLGVPNINLSGQDNNSRKKDKEDE